MFSNIIKFSRLYLPFLKFSSILFHKLSCLSDGIHRYAVKVHCTASFPNTKAPNSFHLSCHTNLRSWSRQILAADVCVGKLRRCAEVVLRRRTGSADLHVVDVTKQRLEMRQLYFVIGWKVNREER